MKILCPVDRLSEVRELASLGAGEFYGGFVTSEWEERFTLAASANRRSFPEAQIRGEGTLRDIVAAAHDEGVTFALTVNSPFYSREQIGPLVEIVECALRAGVDSLIVADTGFILEARERWPEVPLHLSSLAEVANGAAVAFYRNLGIGRIALPRHLALADIERLVRGSPGMKFDVFVIYGQCANAEGFCTFSHDHPRRVWPCVQEYRIEQEGAAGGGGGRAPALCSQMLWGGLNRGEACGLCALHDLRRIGVEGLKVVGRGTSPERKRWAVGTLAFLLGLLEEGEPDRGHFARQAKEIYRREFPRGCRPTLCYFPELLDVADG